LPITLRGKTYTFMKLGTELGGPIAFIDTGAARQATMPTVVHLMLSKLPFRPCPFGINKAPSTKQGTQNTRTLH
jgi:hypothetical protein